MTKEQIEEKKQLLQQKLDEVNSLKEELLVAGAWPLDDMEIESVSGGNHPQHHSHPPRIPDVS